MNYSSGAGGDYFNQLRGKVEEMKQRRDQLNMSILKDNQSISSLDQQI